MTDELRVSPEQLRTAGDQISRHGETLAAVAQSCHDRAQGGQGGWVGRSAIALAGLLDGWATIGRVQCQRIGEQARALHEAAVAFAAAEQGGAARLAGG